MKSTTEETETTDMEDLTRIPQPNRSLDKDYLSIRSFMKRQDIEEQDPCFILDRLREFPHEGIVPDMLAWYRSGDLWKVTMATSYFKQSDVLDTVARLLGQIQDGSSEEARAARRRLSNYGEIALRRATKVLSGQNLLGVIEEIFSQMEARSIPLVLKSLRKETADVRISIINALAVEKNHHALPVLMDLIGEIVPPTHTCTQENNRVPTWGNTWAWPVLN